MAWNITNVSAFEQMFNIVDGTGGVFGIMLVLTLYVGVYSYVSSKYGVKDGLLAGGAIGFMSSLALYAVDAVPLYILGASLAVVLLTLVIQFGGGKE